MKKCLVLSAVLSVSAIASTIGTCVPGALSGHIGNPCSLGDEVFESFAANGDADASRINLHFQMAATEFHIVLEPLIGASFLTPQSFADRIALLAGVALNIPPGIEQIVGVQDQARSSPALGASGQPVVTNVVTNVVANTLVPDTETDGPTFSALTSPIVTTSILTGSGGTGAASPGVSSFEFGSTQADAAVPEPASFALIGIGLLCLGLLRRRAA